MQCVRCHACRPSGEPCSTYVMRADCLIEARYICKEVQHTRDAGLRNGTGLRPFCPAAGSRSKTVADNIM